MRAVSTAQMRALDRIAISRYGIPSLLLMENAGRGIADLATRMMNRRRNVLVVCGPGNNGGDGFVAARHLANRGVPVQVILLAAARHLNADPKTNYHILKKMGVPIKTLTSMKKPSWFARWIHQASLIIDAIFGIGLSRPVSGLFFHVISEVNAAAKPVLSIDIPSGLHSDTGEVLGTAIRASETGTLGMAKRGLYFGEGPKLAGRVTVLDISIPKSLEARAR